MSTMTKKPTPMDTHKFAIGDKVTGPNGYTGIVTKLPAFKNDYYTVTWIQPVPFGVIASKVSPLTLTFQYEWEDTPA